MKTTRHRLSVLVAASALVVASASSFAHDGAGHRGMGGPGGGMHAPGERIVTALNLDAARAEQVRAIVAEAQKERRAVWESLQGKRGDEAARDAARQQMRTIGENTRTKLAQVLTPDEVRKLQELRGRFGPHGQKGPKQG